MDNLEKIKNDVVSNLRACLISAPGGILSSSLNKDYKALVGEDIPYRKLGFKTLETFLESLPDISVKRKNGDYFIEASKSADSAHITNLVERQKRTSKRNSRRRPMPGRRSSYMRQTSEQQYKFSPPKFRQKQNISNFTTLQPQTSAGFQSYKRNTQPRSYNGPPDYSHIKPLLPDFKKPIKPPISKPVVNKIPIDTASQPKPIAEEKPKQNDISFNPLPISSSSPIKKKEEKDIPQCPIQFSNMTQLPQYPIQFSNMTQLPQYPIQFSNMTQIGAPNINLNKKPIVTNNNVTPKSTQFIFEESPYKHNLSYSRVILPTEYPPNSRVKKLSDLAKQNFWPVPEFFILRRKTNKGPDKVICRASIVCPTIDQEQAQSKDSYEYTSYPNEFTDPEEALECVAERAFYGLISKSTTMLPETQNTELVILRIADIVKGRHCGVWGFQVVNDYEQTYGEALPPNVPELLRNTDVLKVDQLTPSQYIIYDESIEEKPIKALQHCPPLILPDEEVWDVFVTSVLSINRITVRLVGPEYSVEFEKLSHAMDTHYLKTKLPPVSILQIGRYYMHVDSDSCSRVLLLEMKTDYDDNPLVMFIDHGEKDTVHRSTLRVIKDEYLHFPAQSFEVNLTGLDHYMFKSPPYKRCTIQDMVGRTYVAVANSRDPFYVTLNDTSGDIDININELILREIRYSFTAPQLEEVGKVTEVIVVAKTEDGDVIINVPSNTLFCLQEKLDMIDDGQVEVKTVSCMDDLNVSNVYILRGETTLRAMIRELVSFSEVDVDLIDVGFSQRVQLEELLFAPCINDLLYTIPAQAYKVSLFNVDKQTLRAKRELYDELLPLISKAIIKLIVPSQTPQVEFFRRTNPGNALISVNDALIFDQKSVSDFQNPTVLDMSKLSLDNGLSFEQEKFGLPKPVLPKIDENFFNIYVIDFANPHNFTVQPVSYLPALNQLMMQMKNHYNKLRMYPQETFWNTGDLCVVPSEHTGDSYFYRAYIEQIIDDTTVSVRYFDYGNMGVFNTHLLRPLLSQFKSLPFIGFNAKLHRIKPKNVDWDAQVCTEMKTFMNNKKFFAIIKSVNVGYGNSFSTLSLDIIDTSTNEDVDIAAKLVHSGAAIYQ